MAELVSGARCALLWSAVTLVGAPSAWAGAVWYPNDGGVERVTINDAGAIVALPEGVSAGGVDGGDIDSGDIDAGASEGSATPAPAMEVEAFEPVESTSSVAPAATEPIEGFEVPTAGPTVRFFAHVRSEVSLDLRFDSPRGAPLAENVADGRIRSAVGADIKVNEWIRVYLEARAQVRGATQRNFDRVKGFFEPTVGEAFVDLYFKKVDVRVGMQRLPLGANAVLAPADALNQRDLRESLINAEPEDSLLPVFAVRAQGDLGPVTWMAAYVPFFMPHRYVVFGQDEALLQPALAPALDTRRVDPSVEDFVQERILETERPPPFLGDVALRVQRAGRIKFGASWVWMNEKLPRVTVDPELASVLQSQASGRAVDPAVGSSLINRFQANETLFRGRYLRQHLFSLEGSALLGPGQLDVDFTYSPRQTFPDAQFRPINKASLSWTVGFSQASESPLVYAVSYYGMVVPGVGAKEQLILLEPATAVGADRTAVFHLVLGSVSFPVWKDHLEIAMRAAFEPIQKSYSFAPRVTFIGIEHLKLWLTAEVYQGPAWSLLGYFDRNDRVLVGGRYDW